jgi:PTS system fructose-specific IIA component/PTS system nitrogen regulatory IIA component
VAHPYLSIFESHRITYNPPGKNKSQWLGALLQLVFPDLDVDREVQQELLKALVKRERSGSTGAGRVAIPHTRHRAVTRTIGALGVFPEGVDFESVDGNPVYSMFLLLSPESAPEEHVHVLRWIATVARKPDFTKFLRQTRTPEEVRGLLEELST